MLKVGTVVGGRTKMFQRFVILMAVLVTIGAALASSEATVVSYTTTAADSGPGAGITYTLDYELVGPSAYHAVFSLSVPAAPSTLPDWYAAWFIFKFDGQIASTLASLNAPPGSGPWSIADPAQNATVKVLTGGGQYSTLLPPGGFSGFYITSVALGDPADNPREGLLLTPDVPTTFAFTFDFTVPEGRLAAVDSMPFQVGYYKDKGNSKGYEVNQLSSTLAAPVPEPTTLLLLGAGFIGAGLLGGRLRRGR